MCAVRRSLGVSLVGFVLNATGRVGRKRERAREDEERPRGCLVSVIRVRFYLGPTGNAPARYFPSRLVAVHIRARSRSTRAPFENSKRRHSRTL